MKSKSLIPFGILSLGLLALSACGHSPQTRFYTLDTTAETQPVQAYAGPPLHLAALKIPVVFDRPEITRDTGAAEMSIDEFSHWGGSLDALLRNALQSDLVATLPPGKLALDVADRQPDTQEIAVTILSIRSSGEGTAMDVQWTQSGKDAEGVRTSTSHTAHLSAAGSAATPAAYSQSLADLMAQLAAAIGQAA